MGNFCVASRKDDCCCPCTKRNDKKTKICTLCRINKVNAIGDEYCTPCYFLEEDLNYEYAVPKFLSTIEEF